MARATDPTERGLIALRAFGATVGVRGAPSGLAGLAGQWSRCLAPLDSVPDEVFELHHADVPVSDEMALRLTWRVNIAGIESRAGRSLMLHAAGLALPDGSVLGLVAPSGTGKTTAAVVLGRAGYGYVTDETLAIDPDTLAVETFAKPLSVIDAGHEEKQLLGPDDLGLGLCPDPLRLTRLVALDRRPEHGSPHLRPASLSEAVPLLVAQSSAIARLPRPLQRIEALLDAVGGLQVLEYADISDALPLIETLMGEPAAPPTTAPVAEAGPGDDPASDAGPGTVGLPLLARSEVTDVLAHDEGLFVLAGEQLVELSPLGEAVFLAAGGGKSLGDLHAAAVAAVGPHPRSEELVSQAVDHLVARGLLHRRSAGRGGRAATVTRPASVVEPFETLAPLAPQEPPGEPPGEPRVETR